MPKILHCICARLYALYIIPGFFAIFITFRLRIRELWYAHAHKIAHVHCYMENYAARLRTRLLSLAVSRNTKIGILTHMDGIEQNIVARSDSDASMTPKAKRAKLFDFRK